MMLGTVADWLKKHWRKGDFQVVPMVSQNATVKPVRPIEEKIKSLQAQASRKRRLPPVASKPKRRAKVKP